MGKLNKSVEEKTIKRYKIQRNHVQLRKSQRQKLLRTVRVLDGNVAVRSPPSHTHLVFAT